MVRMKPWKWLKIRKNKRKCGWKFFLHETLSSLEKSIISWCRKIRIEFWLLCLKLDSEYFLPWKFHEFFFIPMNICDFPKLTEFTHLFCFSTGWSSNLRLEFDWIVGRILQLCFLENYNPLNVFSNGIKFINFGFKKLKIWSFK